MSDDQTRPPAGPHDSGASAAFADFDGMSLEVLRRHVRNQSDTGERHLVEAWASASASRQRYVEAMRALLERAPEESRARAELAWARLADRLREQPARPMSKPLSVRRRPELVRNTKLRGVVFPTRRDSRSAALLAAAAVIVALAGSAILDRAANHRAPATDSVTMRLITTATGQRADIHLSDGSRVSLGVDSRLRLADDFGERSRDLYLDGTAYFDVVHDSTRPFRVHTATAVAQDVGTRFVITAYPESRSTQVVVAAGEVALRPAHDSAAPAMELDAGHLARISPGNVPVVRTVDPEQYMAWMEGRLVFRDAPLSEVVAELHRWYDEDVRIGDSTLARMPLTASFDAESFRETLRVVTTVLPLRAVRRDGVVSLYRRQPGAGPVVRPATVESSQQEGEMRRMIGSVVGLIAALSMAFALLAVKLPAQAARDGVDESAPRFLANLPAAAARAPLDPSRTPLLSRRITLDLRGATVASALAAISEATGLHFAYSRAEVPVDRPVQLQARNITVASALTEVLVGTSVDVVLTKTGQAMLVKRARPPVVPTGTVSGTVTAAGSGEALQGASVALVGARIGAVVNSAGHYEFTAPAGRYLLRARLLGYVAREDSITVVDGQTVEQNFSLQRSVASLNAVVVTGTRQPGRTAVDAPAPVDVFTSEEIRQSGRTETSQILELLAPSFNFPRATVTDGTDHIRPATLRGLNSDQVLVLINGKRRHNSALVNINGSVGRGSMAVDLNAIPPSAIDHIEILRDGAAAQYGSDAIAGVINIILKSDSPGELSGQVGQTARSDGRTSVVDANYSFALPHDGYLGLAGEYRNRDSTNRSGPDSRQQYLDGDPRNDIPQLNDRIDSWVGDPKAQGGSGMFNLGIPFSGGTELYAFGGFSYENGIAAGFFRRPLDNRTIRELYPNGFLPLIESHIWDLSEATGVKGTLGGWNWDLGSVFGRNSFRYNVDNSANVSYGTDTPTRFYAGTMTFDQWSTTLDVQRGFEIGWSQPLSVAWGAEFRRDHYGIQAGDDASWMDGGVPILDGPDSGSVAATGSQVFPGFRPADEQDASRNNIAGYVDIAGNPTENLLIDVAGRAEHYSDFGNTVTGKISMRYEPVKGYALRGSLSNGFRAPSLGQEYFSTTSTNFIAVNGVATPFDIRTFPVTSPEAKALGAQPLKAEKSMNYGIGVALQPVSNLSFTADYYRIDIQHRIVLSGNFTGGDIQELLENAGFHGVSGGRFFTNAIDTRTEGVDLVLQTGANLGSAGTLRFTGGYNHNYTHVTKIADTPPELAAHQQVLFDRTQVGLTEVAQPHDNLRLSADYDVKGVGVVLSESRFGSVTAVSTTPANDQSYGAKWLTDVSLAYHFSNGLTVTGGADNIFNVFPDQTIAANSSGGIFVYSGFSPFGYNGAYYFLRLSVGL